MVSCGPDTIYAAASPASSARCFADITAYLEQPEMSLVVMPIPSLTAVDEVEPTKATELPGPTPRRLSAVIAQVAERQLPSAPLEIRPSPAQLFALSHEHGEQAELMALADPDDVEGRG